MRSGVILAGGQSSRMKADKGLILLKSKPLLLWSYDVLTEVATEIIVSVSKSPSPELLGIINPSAKIVRDSRNGLGPIEGLLLSFESARGEYVAVAPCDAPLIKTALYELLFEKAEGRDGAVPFIAGYNEPLIAVYRRKSLIDTLNKIIAKNKFSINEAIKDLELEYVEEDLIKEVDTNLESFININTFDDFDRIEKLV